jgi:hypothetical protein
MYLNKDVSLYISGYTYSIRIHAWKFDDPFIYIYIKVNVWYSFISLFYLIEYKQGEMWHSALRAEISEEICMFHSGLCQATGT